MKHLAATIASLPLLFVGPVGLAQAPASDGQTLRITRAGSQPSAKGSADFFTGAVRGRSHVPGDSPVARVRRARHL